MAHNEYHNATIGTSEQDISNIEGLQSFLVRSVSINNQDIDNSGANRALSIRGDIGASFNIIVVQKSESASVVDKFYDFLSKTFVSGFSKKTTLKVSMTGNSFKTFLNFPGSYGGSYVINVYAEPGTKTTFTKNSGAKSKNVFIKTIQQNNVTTLTFVPVTTNTSNYQAFSTSVSPLFPSKTEIVASGGSTNINNVTIQWLVKNVENDSHGFGLRVINATPKQSSWYFETTETVNGAVTDGVDIVVDDLTNLEVGMVITAVSGGDSLNGTPTIVEIDEENKVIVLNTIQTFSDNATLTIRAFGKYVDLISDLGLGISFTEITAQAQALTKTVRTAPTNSTVNLNGTYGISGGGHVSISGLNVNNSAANTVQSVSASSTAGSMVMQLDQTGVLTNTTLTFNGSSQSVLIQTTVTVTQHPRNNTTIYLNLDDFITVGTAS